LKSGAAQAPVEAADFSSAEARRILQFIGYGRLAAPIWFVGLEEGLSSLEPADLAHNLKARGKWDEVMDLERAHLLLHHNGEPMQIAIKPPRTQTWTWMAKIAEALASSPDWDDRGAAGRYVRRRLGRSDPAIGETLLTELSPIPSKRVAENQKWRDFFRRIDPECDRIIINRLVKLRALIDQHRPPFVFCYGSENPEPSQLFKRLFPTRTWRRVAKKSQMSESDGRFAVLMPFFGNGRLSAAEVRMVMDEIRAESMT
jgi:hypothetical protein